MKPLLTLLLLLILATASAQTIANPPTARFPQLHPCKMEGVADSLLCGDYPVFENRDSRKGRRINLHVVVIPAKMPRAGAAPIFYIEGGPGVAASSNAAFFTDSLVPYRQYHDIVLVDIRGTGKSNPLHCPSLQVKGDLSQQFEEMYPVSQVSACYDSLSARADLKQYTTTNAVRDLEDLRRWLGLGKINIYGLSYGTRVALAYMKMFPSSIASCILWSPLPTYARMPLYFARDAQQTLDRLFADCKNDPSCNGAFPALAGEFEALKNRWKAGPMRVSRPEASGQSRELSIPWDAFQTKIRSLLYAPAGLRQVPYLVHQAFIGNLEPFIALYPSGPDTSQFLAEGFYLCVTCTEDVPFIDTAEIAPLAAHTFMGSYRVSQQRQACAHWSRGKIPKGFFDPVKSKIPTLILSGSYDPVTPTASAREIASHLSNCTLVLIPEMGHVIDGLSNASCFDELCLRFIDNPRSPGLSQDCIQQMKPGRYKID